MGTIVLSGFMATGKTTLGPRVAARLALPFVDTDHEIERRAGRRVAELWRTEGETGFRRREEALVRELLTDNVVRVIAFGGGTVTNRALRHYALDHAFVVTLDASPEAILARIPDIADRPMLAGGDPLARIASLLEQRAEAYAECHLRLATDDASFDDATTRVVSESRRARIAVPLGHRTYTVEVVEGAPLTLTEALTALAPSSVIVVTDEHVRAARGEALAAALRPLKVPVTEVTLPSGEENKTLTSVQAIWDAAVGAQADRASVVVGFGGGVVGDLAGFAASTLLRGVRVVQAPTTLLAMVDASVGGKTGFDLANGKNLIGSFHQPASVVVDLAHLSTLPRRDLVAGLAEVVKMALGFDEALWAHLEANADALRAGDVPTLKPVVLRAIALKAEVVRDDEREGGRRALLNLGHTLGHALETAGGYSRYLHGEAVALGLVVETLASERLGLAAVGLSTRVRALLERLGLPTEISANELSAAWPLVSQDKKRVLSTLALPLPRRIGESVVQPVSLRDLARVSGITAAG